MKKHLNNFDACISNMFQKQLQMLFVLYVENQWKDDRIKKRI